MTPGHSHANGTAKVEQKRKCNHPKFEIVEMALVMLINEVSTVKGLTRIYQQAQTQI